MTSRHNSQQINRRREAMDKFWLWLANLAGLSLLILLLVWIYDLFCC